MGQLGYIDVDDTYVVSASVGPSYGSALPPHKGQALVKVKSGLAVKTVAEGEGFADTEHDAVMNAVRDAFRDLSREQLPASVNNAIWQALSELARSVHPASDETNQS